MGTWNETILGNDISQDVYSFFFDKYNKGEDPREISKFVKEDFSDYFSDYDDKNNALFGFALAQWETKCLEIDILKEVRLVIESNDDLKFWGDDKKVLNKRKTALNNFLIQISSERPKPKRRQKPKFKYNSVEIVKTASPSNNKTFDIVDEYVNGEYVHSQGLMNWCSGGSGILCYNKPNAKIIANWRNEQLLEIHFEDGIEFSKKEHNFYFYGDKGTIEYIRIANTNNRA